MTISNCSIADINTIMELYEAARQLQTERKMVTWPFFDQSFIMKEIMETRQWKISINDSIACNWAITFVDREIWGEKDKGDSINIHRIATHPTFRGQRYIDKIVKWARPFALQLGKRFIRLDTLGNNTKLIEHYTSAGFEFLGMFELTDTATLPAHYQNEPNCCLFEIDLYSAKNVNIL
jgi:GNAT superfamily N-acetyltransferase